MKGYGARRICAALVAVLSVAALAACVTTSGSGAYVDDPAEWQAIELAEADLNLPLTAPLEIASLERRSGDGNLREEIYTFQGVEGYVKTSRVIGGVYPESVARSVGGGRVNEDFIASLSLPSAGAIFVPAARPFLNGKSRAGKSLSRGFAAGGSAPPRYKNCFVARVAYLFVELEAVDNSNDQVFDTMVEVLLCGVLPRETDLLRMMAQVDAVTDRDTFRKALSQHSPGTS